MKKKPNPHASALGKLAKGVITKRKTESSRKNVLKARAAKAQRNNPRLDAGERV